MKTDNSLLEKMLSDDNLNQAYLRVYRNKGAEGIDGMKYTDLKEYLKAHGEEIKEQIRTKTYKPQPVRRVEIPKDNGGVRELGIPTVLDRFVQQAITQVLTPIYEPIFSDNSYGFRPNRCCEMANIKALECMNDGYHVSVNVKVTKNVDLKITKNGNINKLVTFFVVSL